VSGKAESGGAQAARGGSRAGVGWLRKLWFLHVMVGVCLVSATAHAREPDGCQLRFPRSLAAAKEKRFPDHRLPRVADVPRRDRLAWIGRQGGDECLLVATGDFDGDGSLDIAAVLPARKGDTPILVAALYTRGTWNLTQLPFWDHTAARAYVNLLPPGAYHMTLSADHPLEAAERASFTSSRVGFVSGAMEATGVAYFADQGAFVYIWIAS